MSRPPESLSRRRILQSAAAFSTAGMAGCLGSVFGDSCTAGADFTMDPATDAHIANSVSSNVADLPPLAEQVVTDTIPTGTATYRSYYELNVHDAYVVRDGEPIYYRVTVEAGDHAETTGYRYDIAFGDDVPAPSDGDRVVDFEALPQPDRKSFLGVLGAKAKLRKADGARFGVTFAYTEEPTRNRSAFVPRTDIAYVRWQGKNMQVTFNEKQSVSIVTYTVSTTRVADSTAAFVDHILEESGIVLADLTADQQDVVAQAIDGGYNACEPYSDAFRQLLDRLSTGEHDFVSFVRYRDTWYFADVSQWVK